MDERALNAAIDLKQTGDLPDTMPGFYSLDRILQEDAEYNVIFGERGNGKTYAVLKHALLEYVSSGFMKELAIIRRYQEDLTSKRAFQMFAALIDNDEVRKATNGRYHTIVYKNGKWYLAKHDEKLDRYVPKKTPFAYAFSLSSMEHDKSISFPHVTNILFDEFLTRQYYLPEEFMLFQNVLSTIIRNRDNVKIFMCGNTVNKYSPYFGEMGLYKVPAQEQGTIDLYTYGETQNPLKVAVEYCANIQTDKPSNKYFAFDNPNLKMITGGKWHLALYPHLQKRFKESDIIFTYFIEWGDQYLQCEIVNTGEDFFTYVHEKTTPLKNPDTDIVYSLEHSQKNNYRRRLLSQSSPLEHRIAWFYAAEKVFFQNNECGEVVRNYIRESMKSQFAATSN